MYLPNLTADADTGLGAWTDEQVIMAIRQGVRPDGRSLAPVMAWASRSRLSDEDALAIAAYLRSVCITLLPAVTQFPEL